MAKLKKPASYRKPKSGVSLRQVSKSLNDISARAAQGTFRGLARHQSKTNSRVLEQTHILETLWSSNLMTARLRFQTLRVERVLRESGEEDSYTRFAWGWVVDCLHFLVILLWGVIEPILIMLAAMVVYILTVIGFTALTFYALYKLITL